MTSRRTAARRKVRARPPWWSIPLAAVAVAFVAIPFIALLQRAPWSDLGDLLGRPVVTDALRLSLTTAFAATGISLVLGIPLAWVLARTEFPGRSLRREPSSSCRWCCRRSSAAPPCCSRSGGGACSGVPSTTRPGSSSRSRSGA